mmetsp:Transcript_25930/g.48319  ORF Transcript_25930/g.48319 Transcript_25930/m.48319 type:complete len:237 (+) Transcript_25930:649-1359(+)
MAAAPTSAPKLPPSPSPSPRSSCTSIPWTAPENSSRAGCATFSVSSGLPSTANPGWAWRACRSPARTAREGWRWCTACATMARKVRKQPCWDGWAPRRPRAARKEKRTTNGRRFPSSLPPSTRPSATTPTAMTTMSMERPTTKRVMTSRSCSYCRATRASRTWSPPPTRSNLSSRTLTHPQIIQVQNNDLDNVASSDGSWREGAATRSSDWHCPRHRPTTPSPCRPPPTASPITGT